MRLLTSKNDNLRDATERSLTLLRVFLAASALILAVGAIVLSTVLTRTLTEQSVADHRESETKYVDGVLRSALVHDDRLRVDPKVSSLLLGELRRDPNLVTVKVWRPDGVLAWTNRAQNRIGKRFDEEGELEEALHGETAGTIGGLDEDENAVERSLGFNHLLEVYAPVLGADGKTVLGAYEIYADPADLEQAIASRRHVIWGAVALVFLALWTALALLVRGASSTLRRQTRELKDRSRALMDSYQQLEESSQAAIESLNATVEAKDPNTGRPLDARAARGSRHRRGARPAPRAARRAPLRRALPRHRQDRRARRDPPEARGAELLGERADEDPPGRGCANRRQVRPAKDAVPVIRHHHERWDGEGYPDGVAGEEIPLEAAITGLAEAWDAMTTERPYRHALTPEQALAEIRAGSGTQFSPEVVDAFFRAAARRPEDLGLDGPATAALSAG